MSDLISRQALINKAEYEAEAMAEPFKSQLPVLVAWLAEKIPSEEPERKKGKWTIKTGELAIWDVCSECKKMVMHKAPFYNYCPNCGADMRGEQE